MNLEQLKSRYLSGALEKGEYIKQMCALHAHLFEYPSLIADADIESIEIRRDSVIVTSRDCGVRLILDIHDTGSPGIGLLNFGAYERGEAGMFFRLIQGSGDVLDIGANLGWYSLNIAKRFPQKRVHAFEPVPTTFAKFEANIRLNGLNNISPYNVALSDKSGAVIVYLPSRSGAASMQDLSGEQSVQEVRCMTDRLDDFVESKGIAIGYIKCDVEGAELLVFDGGLKAIARDQPIILTEMLRKWSARFGYHPNNIIELLRGLGYSCFVLHGDGLRKIQSVNEETIETNYFFLHEDKHTQQISILSR